MLFLARYALKGQKLLAQGIALGNYGRKPVALKGQKLSILSRFYLRISLSAKLARMLVLWLSMRMNSWAEFFM